MSRVKVRAFIWHDVQQNPYNPDQKILIPRVSVRDEELNPEDLSPYDRERAERHGVFYKEGEQTREGTTVGEDGEVVEKSVDDMSVEELATWIKEDEPTIDDLLELASDDPDQAQKILDAENMATSNDPRKGLVTGLTKVIGENA